MSQFTAEALLLLVTALWGGTFVIIKTALGEIPPLTFTFYRFLLAAILALLIWPRAARGWNRAFAGRGAILGALFGTGFLLQAGGLATTTATTSAFITSSAVVFVPFVFRIVERTKIRPLHIVSVCFVILGLYFFTQPGVEGPSAGDLLTLGSAMVWAIYITYIDVWTREISDRPHLLNGLVLIQFIVTAVLSGLAALVLESNAFVTTVSFRVAMGLVYCTVFASVFATWIQTRFQRFTHPVRASIIFTAEPIFAALVAWMTIGEEMKSIQGVGAAIMILAIVVPDIIVAYRNRR
ncbi:MAG: DMT family transporter [Ignavibacteria bacterium]|nr:DMT family transporter [Ignavibacteria bacterium]